MSTLTPYTEDLVLAHQWRHELGACGCGMAISSADEYGAHVARLAWDQGFDAGTYAPGGALRAALRSPIPTKDDNPYGGQSPFGSDFECCAPKSPTGERS